MPSIRLCIAFLASTILLAGTCSWALPAGSEIVGGVDDLTLSDDSSSFDDPTTSTIPIEFEEETDPKNCLGGSCGCFGGWFCRKPTQTPTPAPAPAPTPTPTPPVEEEDDDDDSDCDCPTVSCFGCGGESKPPTDYDAKARDFYAKNPNVELYRPIFPILVDPLYMKTVEGVVYKVTRKDSEVGLFSVFEATDLSTGIVYYVRIAPMLMTPQVYAEEIVKMKRLGYYAGHLPKSRWVVFKKFTGRPLLKWVFERVAAVDDSADLHSVLMETMKSVGEFYLKTVWRNGISHGTMSANTIFVESMEESGKLGKMAITNLRKSRVMNTGPLPVHLRKAEIDDFMNEMKNTWTTSYSGLPRHQEKIKDCVWKNHETYLDVLESFADMN